MIQGARLLGLELGEVAVDKCLQLLELLTLWNRKFNLTAVRDRDAMVVRHLLDSLAVLPQLRGRRIADVGAGPGFPGLPLALARPDLDITLIDSRLKQTRFARHAIARLGLANARVVRSRVEAVRPQPGFDSVVSRAFAAPIEVFQLTAHLLAPGGRCIAYAGPLQGEPPAVAGYRNLVFQAIRVPFLDEPRHFVIGDKGVGS